MVLQNGYGPHRLLYYLSFDRHEARIKTLLRSKAALESIAAYVVVSKIQVRVLEVSDGEDVGSGLRQLTQLPNFVLEGASSAIKARPYNFIANIRDQRHEVSVVWVLL